MLLSLRMEMIGSVEGSIRDEWRLEAPETNVVSIQRIYESQDVNGVRAETPRNDLRW